MEIASAAATRGVVITRTLQRRSYSGWVRQIFARKAVREETGDHIQGKVTEVDVSPSEHLRQLVQDHLPEHYSSDGWVNAPLHQDTQLKAKVLLSCENKFDCNFSDRRLGSIRTFQDVLRTLNRPKRYIPQTVFPKIERIESLPPNLSVQSASVVPSSRKRARQPFQNYDSPEHANFLNKQQKEARKRKRRHLTAITKRYN